MDQQEFDAMSPREAGDVGQHLPHAHRRDQAQRYLLLAIERALQRADTNTEAWATLHLGSLCRDRREYRKAATLFQRTVDLARPMDDPLLLGLAHDALATTYLMQGSYPQAIEHCNEANRISERIGDQKGLASGYANLGTICRLQSDYPPALDAYQRALELFQKLGDQRGMAQSYEGLGDVCLLLGGGHRTIATPEESLEIVPEDFVQSIGVSEQTLDINEDWEDPPGIASARGIPADWSPERGHVADALRYYGRALKILEDIGDYQQAAILHLGLGNLWRGQGDPRHARHHFHKAEALFEMFGDARRAEVAATALRLL